ncbi:hypothetical protein pb186bvf_011647 [Paramecium bursaria]
MTIKEKYIEELLWDYIEVSQGFCIIANISYETIPYIIKGPIFNRVGAIIILSGLSLLFRFFLELFIIIVNYQHEDIKNRFEIYEGFFQAIQSICRISLFYVFFNIITKQKMQLNQKNLTRYLYIVNQIIYMGNNSLSLYLFQQSQDPEQILFDYWNMIRYGGFIAWVLLNWAFFYFVKRQEYNQLDFYIINWILFQILASGLIFLIFDLRIRLFNDELQILDCKNTQLICSNPYVGFGIYTLFFIQIKLYIPVLTILWFIFNNSEKFLENISIK